MTRHAAIRHRLIALLLWAASVAWVVLEPDSPDIHRIILAAAISSTVVAAMSSQRYDAEQTSRLAHAAGYRQAQVEQTSDR